MAGAINFQLSEDPATDTMPDALDDRSLGQRAYDSIFTAIQSGRLPPGARVREADLTSWLDMSRTPLRDALQRLQGEGLLRLQAHRGITICRLDRQQTIELFTAREWAEGAAAALAARNATPTEVQELRHILALERGAKGNVAEGARYNWMLHRAIYDATRNRYLIEHLRKLVAQLALVGGATRRAAHRARDAQQEHAAMIDAIAAGDAERAEALARAHIRAAQLFVLTHRAKNTTEGDNIRADEGKRLDR